MRSAAKFASLMIAGALCVGGLHAADAATPHSSRKTKKPELAPLPSGPQGPVPQVPLDSIPAVAPLVSYHDGQLTILAPNSTLGDILRAVRKQTAAEMEIPGGSTERVVTHLGPGPAREVVAELLNGSRFNYVLLGSPSDATSLTRVVLVAKTGPDVAGGTPLQPQGGNPNMAPPPAGDPTAEAADAADAPEENADDSADQAAAAEAEQPPAVQDQQGIKTPQQMLQEMQQRQLQMQQQLAPGQPPIPGGAGIPQRPQQDQ